MQKITTFYSNRLSDAQWVPANSRDLTVSHVFIPSYSHIMPATTKTIEFWVQRTQGGASIAFTMEHDNGGNRVLAHIIWSNDNIYWDNGDIGNYGRLVAYAPASLRGGDWTHVALVVDADTNRVAVYLNGELFAQQAGYGHYTDADEGFCIGGNGIRHDGRLGEFRIWNYARTPDQTKADMNKVFNGPKAGLIGCWRLDDNVPMGGTILDRSGKNNHGTWTQ